MKTAATIVLLVVTFISTIGTIGGKEKDARLNALTVALASIAAVVTINILGR